MAAIKFRASALLNEETRMAIPANVFYPPFNIVRLSHVSLTVSDLAASRAFYVDTLGLQVTN